MLAVVKSDANALGVLKSGSSLKNDESFAIEACKINGEALEHVAEKLQGNREVVLAAVRNYGPSLKYASELLREDKNIVLEAISNDSCSFQYATYSLRKDRAFLYAVGIKNLKALRYVGTDDITNVKPLASTIARIEGTNKKGKEFLGDMMPNVLGFIS